MNLKCFVKKAARLWSDNKVNKSEILVKFYGVCWFSFDKLKKVK